MYEEEFKPGGLATSLAELSERLDTARTPGARADAGFFLHIYRALAAAVPELRLTAPTDSFDGSLDLGGSRRAQLKSFGRGHTEADAILHLPSERVVFAGDLVVSGVQPSMGSGDPEHWLVVLDEIDRLGAERIVPGHGPVVGPDGTGETREYVRSVLEAARAPSGAALPPPLRPWEGSMSLEDNLRFAREWVAQREPRR
jgi:glyoxylase-like metal-dependent hydrolase (beta-lactamase superfamily II)